MIDVRTSIVKYVIEEVLDVYPSFSIFEFVSSCFFSFRTTFEQIFSTIFTSNKYFTISLESTKRRCCRNNKKSHSPPLMNIITEVNVPRQTCCRQNVFQSQCIIIIAPCCSNVSVELFLFKLSYSVSWFRHTCLVSITHNFTF